MKLKARHLIGINNRTQIKKSVSIDAEVSRKTIPSFAKRERYRSQRVWKDSILKSDNVLSKAHRKMGIWEKSMEIERGARFR